MDEIVHDMYLLVLDHEYYRLLRESWEGNSW